MKFTATARELLDLVPGNRRAKVGNWAKRIALEDGKNVVGVGHVESAILCAGEEFMPDSDEGEWLDE